MKMIKLEHTMKIATKIAEALGIPPERTQRIILDVDVSQPVAVLYVQMIGDIETIDAVCDLIGPYYTQEPKEE